MTNTTPIGGTAPACPMDTSRSDTSPEAIRARVAEFADWFGVEPVKVKTRKGSVCLVAELIEWCRANGASLDWILLGDPKGMAETFRAKHARTPVEQEILDALPKLSEPAREAFVAGLQDVAAGRITFQDFEDRMRAYQAEPAAAG